MKDAYTLNDKIAKLPKWAQSHIEQLTRERDEAIQRHNAYLDDQKPSPVWVEQFTRQHGNNVFLRRYIDAYRVNFEANGVTLEVLIADPNSNQHDGIHLTWGASENHMRHVAFVPKSFQQAEIICKEDMT